jgi:hypothetical protein
MYHSKIMKRERIQRKMIFLFLILFSLKWTATTLYDSEQVGVYIYIMGKKCIFCSKDHDLPNLLHDTIKSHIFN